MRQKILLCNIFCQYFSEEQSVDFSCKGLKSPLKSPLSEGQYDCPSDFYAGNLLSRTFRFKKISIPCNFLATSQVLYMKGPQQPFTTQGIFGKLFLPQCSLSKACFLYCRLPKAVARSGSVLLQHRTCEDDRPLYIVHPYKTYTQKSGRFPSWGGRFSHIKKDYVLLS